MVSEVDQPGIDVLRTEILHVKESLGDVRTTLASINSAVQALVRIEQKQVAQHEALGRAFVEIDDHEKRLRVLENERGVHGLVKNWVIAGVVGIAAIFGLQLLRLVG